MYSHEYTDKDQREYERFAAMCAQQGMQGHEKFVGPCALYLKFYFEVPKSRARKIQEGDWHPQRPDRDNCEKSIMDACNGIVWADDCTVCFGQQECRWTFLVPRTEVRVESL